MIIDRFAQKSGIAVVIPEDEDDLWSLRRLIRPGDYITTDTTRVVKQKGDFIRPNKGNRIHVNVALIVLDIRLDNSLGRLKIIGKVVEASDESVSHGDHHSLLIYPEKKIAIKKKKWSDLEKKILLSSRNEPGFLIIAIDRREAGFGRIKGTHLKTYPEVESGASGKIYSGHGSTNQNYYKKILNVIQSILRNNEDIFICGPGSIKNIFGNICRSEVKELAGRISIIEGVDIAGDDGVRMALKSPTLRKLLQTKKIAQVGSVLDDALSKISKDDHSIAIGLNDALKAAKIAAINYLLISDQAFSSSIEEKKIINLLNLTETSGGKTYLVDSSTELGLQISSLSGILGILRFSINL